jgi:hypothetical protein
MFRKVDSVVWDLMSGKLGVRTREGEIATIEGEGDDATIVINPFEDFGVALPAFAQATPADAVKVGDLIYTSGDAPGWIVQIKNSASDKKTFRIMRAGGNVSSWVPPKVQMFGLDGGVLVVRSLVTMLPGGTDGLAGFQSMMLPMLMMGGDSLDMEKMMPLMLMSQMGGVGGGTAGANPMGGMMQMMMMSKMLGGDGGGLFGGGSSSSKLGPFRT